MVPLVARYRKEMEVRSVYYQYTEEDIEREVRWFEQASYGRAKLQSYVEQVLALPLKARKAVYKKWRAELGDDTARTYAKFAEHLIENHRRPKWFIQAITDNWRQQQLQQSSPSTSSHASYRTSPRAPAPTQPSLL